jgi:hypothetical protein
VAINYTNSPTNVRSIKQGEGEFYIEDDLIVYSRAELKFAENCPKEVASLIIDAFRKNQVHLVANVYDRELVWETLSQ